MSSGRTEEALDLIKLGACVDSIGLAGALPVEKYVSSIRPWARLGTPSGCDRHFDEDFFMALLPARANPVNISRLFFEIVKKIEWLAVSVEMLSQVIQRLNFVQPLRLTIEARSGFWLEVSVNDTGISLEHFSGRWWFCKSAYLYSLLLIEQQCEIISAPSGTLMAQLGTQSCALLQHAAPCGAAYLQAIYDFWKTFHQQQSVRSLLRLCILRIRNSMSGLDDNSFLSLPVPSYLRRLLKCRDVSEKIYEELPRVEKA